MVIRDKTLVVIATRNNKHLLNHCLEGFEKFNSGYDCEYLVLDNSSDDKNHLLNLDKVSSKYRIFTTPWNRIEASFDLAYKNNKEYKYYFFCHDDTRPRSHNWLRLFVDRVNSGYVEKQILNSHYRSLPIGRVSALAQFWREYDNVLGYPVQCLFLLEVLKKLHPDSVPSIIKYGDSERVLITNECLKSTSGMFNLSYFKHMEKNNRELFSDITKILSSLLTYKDKGMYPYSLYPEGQCWNKLCMISEYMSSVDPLISGYRTTAIEGDGYLEQIHGGDIPYGHKYVQHYGSPNMKMFLSKYFNTDAESISKFYKDKIFLMKCDKLIDDYFNSQKEEGK